MMRFICYNQERYQIYSDSQEKDKSMTQIQKKPEWYLVIGLIVSVIFILISVLQNQYTTSILIGIISILVTYLIDLTVKLKDRDERLAIQVNDLGNKIVEISKKSQEEILESVQEEREKITETVLLGEELAEDEELRHIIKDLVDKSEAVKKLNIDAFSKYARNLLEACRDQINDLSDGEEEIPAQYNFVPLEACHLPSHMYIVLSHDPSYLKGRYGTTYLNEQQETIKKNRSITMIWIQPKHILSDPYYKDFILTSRS